MPEVELTGTLAIGSVTESLRPFFEEYLTTQVNNQNSGTRGTLPNKKINPLAHKTIRNQRNARI